MAKTILADSSLVGRQEPTARVRPEYESTDGLTAAKLMSIGGTNLDKWQMLALDDWLGIDKSGRWSATTCGGSVPRQNGKSALVQGRASYGMVALNENVIYTAHLQKTATETFEEMRDFFETKALKPYVQDIKTALGREMIILKNGARIKFLARTRNGGRGQHGDLLIFDEAQELDENQRASFLPAISASANPQTVYVGTPPDPTVTGTVFRSLREKALAGETNKTAWFEFSVDEIGDVSDRKRWAMTNPAMGIRILEATIEGESEQMDADTFARERLGWWSPVETNKVEYALDASAWSKCMSDDTKPEGKTAYGVKFSADGSTVSLCGAVIPEEGPVRISLINKQDTTHGFRWLSDWLNERYMKASCVVIDGRNGVDVLTDRISDVWKVKGSIVRPRANDVIASVSMLTDCVNEGSLTWFRGQDVLNESATTSYKRTIGGGYGFGGEMSGPIEACALALWGAKTSTRNPSRKMRVG